MKRNTIAALAAVAALLTACISKETKQDNGNTAPEAWRLDGDRTVYGLACEGCNDSILVLLPNNGGDPISFDIFEATKNRRILGKPKIGDEVGVVPNATDTLKGDVVIDIDQLKGIWCYIVMPKLKDAVNLSERAQERLIQVMEDSIRENYFIPREYGFAMLRNWAAQSVGYVREQSSLEEESPVVYPQLGYFTEWHLWNGKLVITSGTPEVKEDNTTIVDGLINDTCNIDYLQGDSLVLSSDGISRAYYRKNSMTEVNQKANSIAARLRQQALEQTKE
ncbi:MAG: hypothetical protein IJ196_01655 [Prevotella sp.]|nr:hypothetical protein [Prevotella sp.]